MSTLNARRPSSVGMIGLAAVAIACLFAPAVRGDVTGSQWLGPDDYWYEIKHMTDLDQKRIHGAGALGLPGDGSQYCVPTSTMNMIMYIANHGHPQLLPGTGNWQDQSTYNAAGLNLFVLGLKMGTGADTGTTGGGWLGGAKAWFADSNYDHFNIQHYYANGAWAPTQGIITQAGIGGNLVAFAYGRYEVVDEVWGIPVIERRGGHIVTLATSFASSVTDTYEIGIRDPADSPADTMQSTFGNRLLTAEDHLVIVCPNSAECYARTMTSLNYNASNSRHAYIDEYLTISPKAGYGFVNTGVFPVVKFFMPLQINGSGGQAVSEFAVAHPVLDMVSYPDRTCFPLLVNAGTFQPEPELCLLNPLTGDCAPQFPLPGASKMVIDPAANLFVLAGDEVLRFDKTEDGYEPAGMVALPHVADALAYSDFSCFGCEPIKPVDTPPTIVALSSADLRVMFLTPDMAVKPVDLPIPAGVILRAPAAVAIEPVSPGRGVTPTTVWMASEASNVIYGVGYSMARGRGVMEQISLPAIQQPSGLGFDDKGHMFVSTVNGLVELGRDALGRWVVVVDSDFAGFDVGPSFMPTTSWTNFDPATMSGPAFHHIDPSELDFGLLDDDCPDPEDGIDSDRDGVPDWCDPCPQDDPDDSDGDGVCDSDDECPGFDNGACDDGNECTLDLCDPCEHLWEPNNYSPCATATGQLGACLVGVCLQVCDDDQFGTINLADHATFVGCLSGPAAAPIAPGCVCSDLNRDGRIDLKDYATLQGWLDGR